MDAMYNLIGFGILTSALIIILCIKVFYTLIRSYKIGKIHMRMIKISRLHTKIDGHDVRTSYQDISTNISSFVSDI